MPSKKPRAKAVAKTTTKTRRIPPKNQALRRMLTRELSLERMNNRQRMVFENLVRQKTLGQALPETRMRRIVQRCAKRVLNLDLIEKGLTEKKRIQRRGKYEKTVKEKQDEFLRRRTSKIQIKKVSEALSMIPEKADLLFESGAEMTARLDLGIFLADWPKTCPGIRIIANVRGQDHPKIFYQVNPSDFLSSVKGGVGYLGLSLGMSRKRKKLFSSKEKEAFTGLIAVRQERFLPKLPEGIRKRYAQWDLELLRYAEAKLRQAGIERTAIAIPQEHRKGVLVQTRKFEKRAEKRGYRKAEIEFTEFLLPRHNKSNSAKPIILVKELKE